MFVTSYCILGNIFTISTTSQELLDRQIRHIAKFCYSPHYATNGIDEKKRILIEYFEDESLFSKYKNLILASNFETLLTFEKEFHAKTILDSEEYFMQLPDKYILHKISNRHFIIIGDGIRDTTKYVFRLIREILVRIQENNNKLFMHATSLVTNNYGISILGNAGSGKTTYFSKLLSVGNCSILSNDRTFFYVEDEQARMDYFPIPVVYKLGAVAHNKFLKKHILDCENYPLPESFKNGSSSYPIPLTDVISFFPNTSFQQTSTLDIIIFSKIDFENPFCFEKTILSSKDANKNMLETCFTPHDSESLRKPWIYPREISDTQLKVNRQKTIKKIIDSVPIYFIKFGKDIPCNELYYQTKHLLEEIK